MELLTPATSIGCHVGGQALLIRLNLRSKARYTPDGPHMSTGTRGNAHARSIRGKYLADLPKLDGAACQGSARGVRPDPRQRPMRKIPIGDPRASTVNGVDDLYLSAGCPQETVKPWNAM